MIGLLPLLTLALGAPEPAPVDLDRPYGLEVTVANVTTVPVLGETRVFTRSLLLVDFEVVDGVLIQRQRLCAVAVDDDARLSSTVIPPAFIAAFPHQQHAVSLEREGGAWRYHADPGPVYIGFDPAQTGGPLPQEVDSVGVVDWDGDGAPGATVNLVVPVLGAIDLYIAQAGHSLLNGAVLADGSIAGHVEIRTLDQRTLGASHRLFHTSPAIRPVPALSTFRLAPLEPGMDCADLASAWW
ncbi:MAG: hypothetical protein H6739_04395 [Alphaproteobacteria bacterium]|nr:hypothetical protein [Alphaproteobacteria bacterium]